MMRCHLTLHTSSIFPLFIKMKGESHSVMPDSSRSLDYTVHGILKARLLEWVAFPFSRGSSQPKDRTQVSRIAGGFFTSLATREAQEYCIGQSIPFPVDLPNPGIEPGLLQCRGILYQLSYQGVYYKKTTNNKYWQGCGEKETLVHCCWEHKLV